MRRDRPRPTSVVALPEISRMPVAAAEYRSHREKRRMFRPSISFVAVVAAAALPAGFAVSFEAGSRDDAGRFMGGTEMRVLAGHAGKLYAGNGYWEDRPGPGRLLRYGPSLRKLSDRSGRHGGTRCRSERRGRHRQLGGGIFKPPTIPLAVDHEARDLRCSVLSFLRSSL
jgi:hypothetical protein